MPSVNTTEGGKPREPLRILQLNVHRSDRVMTSLFNSPETLLFHLLLIQEPHINFYSQLPKSDPNWHMMPPLMPHPSLTTDNARVKSVVYVNNQIPRYCFAAIETNPPVALPLPPPPPPLSLSAVGPSPRHG